MAWEHSGRVVRGEIRTSAEPARVWAAWTEPDRIAGWFVDRAEGETVAGATVHWFFDAFGFEFPVEVVETDPPRRLVLKEALPSVPPRYSEIDIEGDGDGTLVRFAQSGFPEDPAFDEEFAGVERGWTLALATLRHYVESHFGQPRESVLVMRPAVVDHAALAALYTTEEGLKRWLTSAGSIGEVGEPIDLALWEGDRMTGTVLARPLPEVLVSWDEIDGAFTLKTFKMGPTQHMVALHAIGWGMNAARAAELTAWMEASLDRLIPVLTA